MVALKQIPAREGELPEGDLHVLAKTNHCRGVSSPSNFTVCVILQAFGLALERHHHGPTPCRDVQRLV